MMLGCDFLKFIIRFETVFTYGVKQVPFLPPVSATQGSLGNRTTWNTGTAKANKIRFVFYRFILSLTNSSISICFDSFFGKNSQSKTSNKNSENYDLHLGQSFNK